MAVLEEVNLLKQQGRSDSEIMQSLRQRGVPQQEIDSALSQTQIKQAVSGFDNQNISGQNQTLSSEQEFNPNNSQNYSQNNNQNYQSLMNQEIPSPQIEDNYNNTPTDQFQSNYEQTPYSGNYGQEAYGQGGYDYGYGQTYGGGSVSADTISEIADQIVSEKISALRNQIEKSIDAKTTAESKLSILQERLERIERIIDKLQLSILQKVGEYGESVIDLKKELIETQKSFNAVHSKKHDTKQGKK